MITTATIKIFHGLSNRSPITSVLLLKAGLEWIRSRTPRGWVRTGRKLWPLPGHQPSSWTVKVAMATVKVHGLIWRITSSPETPPVAAEVMPTVPCRRSTVVHRPAAEGGARAWRYMTRWDDVDLTKQR